jgi:hypothetical protein
MALKFRLLLHFCFLFGLVAVSYSIFAKECADKSFNYSAINDDNLLIINLRINNRSAIADLEIYQIDDQLLIPLSAITESLKLELNFSSNTLSGKLPNQQCEYTFTLKNSTTNKGSTAQDWLWSQDEFDSYIDIRFLELLLDTKHTFDFSLQQITLNTTVSLPIFAAEKQQTIAPSKAEVIAPELILDDQYKALTFPVISYQSKFNTSKSNTALSSTTQLNSFFDLAGQSAELRINSNEFSTNQYLRFSKKFTSQDDDIAAYVTHYQVGDIQSQGDELIQNSNQGRGFLFSNKNPTFNSSFNTLTIEEPSLPGWRAELYRNGQFLAQTTTADDNRVVFTDVDTFYGANIFEIKLYGPEGQQITKQQKIIVGNNAMAKNQWNYQVEFVDASARLIDSNISISNGFTKSAKAAVSYGLSNSTTLNISGNFIQQITPEQALLTVNDRYYISSSLQGTTFDGRYNLTLAKELSGGSAIYSGYSGNISEKTSLNLNYSKLSNFTSAQYRETNKLSSQLNARLNGDFFNFDGLNWRASFSRQTYQQQNNQNIAQLSLSKSLSQGTFSSSFAYNNLSGKKGILNRLYWSVNANRWQWSNSVDWYPFDQLRIRQVRSDLRWPQQAKFFQQTLLSYSPDAEAKLRLTHQLTYRQAHFNLQFSGQVDEQGEWLLSAGISGTLGYDYIQNQLMWRQPQALNAGLIEASVFLDENRNNIQDNDEQGIENVKFKGRFDWINYQTNQQGEVLLPGTYGGQTLSVNENSLPDAFQKAKYKNVLIHTHQGGINKVQIPVLVVNDIEGSIYKIINNETRAAFEQKVSLLDIAGQVVAETTTESDGYFVFSLVPPGNYSLAVSSPEIEQQKLTPINLPQNINASSLGDAIILNDILLVDQQYIANQQHQATSNKNQLAYNFDNDRFFIQLGVYDKYISIYTATQHLPANLLDIQIFYNKQKKRYYLVSGPFESTDSALPEIEKLRAIEEFAHVFLVRTNRYQADKWQLVYQLQNLKNRLKEGEKIVLQTPAHQYFCQLASYNALNSIDSSLFLQTPELFVIKRNVFHKTFYSLLVGPFKNQYGKSCQESKYRHVTPEQPTDRTVASLQQELMP